MATTDPVGHNTHGGARAKRALDGRMVEVKLGTVARVVDERPGCQRLLVQLDDAEAVGVPASALCFPALTGAALVGDRVSLNTSAVTLGVGTGGDHIVMSVYGRKQPLAGGGHIFKLRYTPSQVPLVAVEAPESPHHQAIATCDDLGGVPVLVATLHSLAGVCAVALRMLLGDDARLVYVMTDGAALPAALSGLLAELRSGGWFDAVITAGHAFGGDYEAVTVASALAAAVAICRADAVVVAMGPGIVGTDTPLGHTAVEQGPILDAATALHGRAIAVPRVSFADPRPRHRGLSHHTMTALTRFAREPAEVALPKLNDPGEHQHLLQQSAALEQRHRVHWRGGRVIARWLDGSGLDITSMGRHYADDPAFYEAAAAAALLAAGR